MSPEPIRGKPARSINANPFGNRSLIVALAGRIVAFGRNVAEGLGTRPQAPRVESLAHESAQPERRRMLLADFPIHACHPAISSP